MRTSSNVVNRSAGRTRVRTVCWIALAAGSFGLLGSCGEGAVGPKPLKEVRLGYFANITHAQAVLGVNSGDFAKAVAPAVLTTRVFNAGPSLIEALFAGEIDVGYVGPGPALSAYEKSHGEGIRVIAGAAANGVLIVARADSGITSMADLVGKRIATPQLGNTQDIAARHYMIYELKQPNADNVLPVPNSEQLAMMARGQIDAAWVPEPWGARLEAEAGGKVIAEEKEFWPSKEFGLTVIVVRPAFLAEHPEVVERLLKVHVDWTHRLQNNPDEQAALLEVAMTALTGKKLDRAIIDKSLERVRFTIEPLPNTFETMAQWALDLGFAQTKPAVSKMFDTTILRKVAGAVATPAATQGNGGA